MSDTSTSELKNKIGKPRSRSGVDHDDENDDSNKSRIVSDGGKNSVMNESKCNDTSFSSLNDSDSVNSSDRITSTLKRGRKKKIMVEMKPNSGSKSDVENNSLCDSKSVDQVQNVSPSNKISVEGKKSNYQVEENPLSIVPLVKKRGRKKKMTESSDNSFSDEHSFSHCSTSIANDNAAVKGVIKKIKVEPPDYDDNDQTLHMSCDDMDASNASNQKILEPPREKRGRGRPRKNPIDSAGVVRKPSVERKQFTLKKLLRPNDDIKSISSSSSSGAKPFKRRPGRPRKSDVSSSCSIKKSSTMAKKNSNSDRKRRIVKPKRYESYESFDFMDVSDRTTFSPHNTSIDDRDDDSDALRIDEGDEEETEVRTKKNKSGSDTAAATSKSKPVKKRKKRTLRLEVECGVCHQKMSEKDYEMKHMDSHNYICWLQGEKPLDPNNEGDIIGLYFKISKTRKNFPGLRCMKCGAKKKSGVGYFSHVQMCGMTNEEREAMKVPCPICNRVMLPSSLKVHLNQEHRTPEKESQTAEVSEVIPLTKRAAAARAETKLEKVLAEEVKDDSHNIKKTLSLKRFYKQTQSKLYPNAYVKWRMELEENGSVKCIVAGCKYSTNDLKVIRTHFYQCPMAVRVFICKICDFKQKTENDMLKHIASDHKDALTGDSDFQMNTDGHSEEEEGDFLLEPDFEFETIKLSNAVDKPTFIVQAIRKKGLSFFSDILDKTYKRYKENMSKDPLFEEFVPPLEEVLSDKEAEKYLPITLTSINFSSENSNWKKLERFKSCSFEGTKLLFTGGPVWALSWCPVPLEETRQFLAVGCHPDMNMIHAQGSIHSYDNTIQIWDCGDFDNLKGINDVSVPRLKLGIAHSHGAVWSLEWCPSGCYQPFCSRMGLLAAGFSDGKVAVYSVPSRALDMDRLPIFKLKPVLELDLITEEPAQCTRVTWSKTKPFNTLACGYSDGLIALFDLTSQSPLLRSGNLLYPYHMFQAHVKSVTGLQFLPKEGSNYLLTASSDRDIKFWNLSDTSSPASVSQLYRTITVTDIVWLNHWLCAASTYDDALGFGLINVSLNAFRDFMFGQPHPIMSQNCLNWGISANDWTNGIATCSDGGEITLLHPKQLFCLDEKSSKRCKRFLTTTDLFKLDGDENADPNIKLKLPQSYEEASGQYGLILKLGDCSSEIPSSRREDLERNFFQIKSINKVAWNPNGRSFLYLAAGYHCGFIQIFRDSNVDNARIVYETFYSKFES